ncbi:MAG: glycoside hydrolase family 3 C-terminal domain-containing protein [Eubacteriales bacterium]|nr:glycoside hydrolase family 3 C-terminal domain-containing protein [Eubacteriales bacterium]
MTLEEKCYMLSGKDFWQTRSVNRVGVPSIFLSDGPHGVRKQAGAADQLGLNASVPATCYPTAATMANSWDVDLAEEMAEALGEEAVSQEVNVLLGPGLNIKRSPLCGRNFEYFSEDPYLAGKMAGAYVKGIQSKGASACPKHFAANSQELRRMASDSVVDERTLREIYLTGFEIAVREAHPRAIMSSYNRVNGEYANENKHLLRDILVDEWGFDGFVVSDWGGSNDHVAGVANGSHLEMPTTGGDSDEELIAAVKSGKISEAAVDERVEELLNVIMQLAPVTQAAKGKEFDVEAHHAMAGRAAEGSIVLLKNDHRTLPLKKGTKVAVIGDFAQKPRYQGAGSSVVNPTKLDSTLDIIENFDLKMAGFSAGYVRTGEPNDVLKQEAVNLAKEAQVVLLYIGLDEISESEGLDRAHMKLPKNQEALLKALLKVNKNIVVVLSAGSPIEMPWADEVPAIIHGYLSGQAGAAAMLKAITGQINPSGKLAETYPFKYEDTPAYHYFPSRERSAEYREGLFVGYRYYATADVPVRYPFGYGLSYTAFDYSDLKATEKEVQFTLKNAGAVDGAEVAQIYVSAKGSEIFRPALELKGFKKVFLKAGESKTVKVLLDDKAFRYFNVKTNKWETEGGEYEILVGASCTDIRLKGSVSVAGTGAPNPYKKNEMADYYSGKITAVSDSEFEALLGHAIPDGSWSKDGLLDANDAICQMYYAKSGPARLVWKILTNMKNKSEAKGKPDLNILFIYNMPFRGIGKMAGGMCSQEMVDGIMKIVNGHFFGGLGKVIGGFFRQRKVMKKANDMK